MLSAQPLKDRITGLAIPLLVFVTASLVSALYNHLHYGEIYPDLKAHFRVTMALINHHTIVQYHGYYYPPFVHFYLGLVTLLTTWGSPINVEQFYKLAYTLFCFNYGFIALFGFLILKDWISPRYLAVLGGLSLVLWHRSFTLLRWFIFPQLCGIVFHVLLFMLLLRVFNQKRLSQRDGVLYFLLTCVLFLTHQYSTGVWILIGAILFPVLFVGGLKGWLPVEAKSISVKLMTLSVIAGVVTFAGYNYRFFERPNVPNVKGRTVVDIFKSQATGKDSRYQPRPFTLNRLKTDLKYTFPLSPLSVLPLICLPWFWRRFRDYSDERLVILLMMAFVLPTLSMSLSTAFMSQHINFVTRIPLFYLPFLIFPVVYCWERWRQPAVIKNSLFVIVFVLHAIGSQLRGVW